MLIFPSLFRRGDRMEFSIGVDETLDHFLGGTLHILQKKKGYRFSIDAILLSRFVRLGRNDKVIDLGTGCAILPLLLSRTAGCPSFTAVEIQEELVRLAEKNVALNHLEGRIRVLRLDFRELRGVFPQGSFDVVFSNPPYRKGCTGRINPSPEKAVARHEIEGTIDDLVRVATFLLRTKGRFYLIYPASRAVDLLLTLRHHNLEPKRIQFVHPRRGQTAKFLLIESMKAAGREVKIMPALALNELPPVPLETEGLARRKNDDRQDKNIL